METEATTPPHQRAGAGAGGPLSQSPGSAEASHPEVRRDGQTSPRSPERMAFDRAVGWVRSCKVMPLLPATAATPARRLPARPQTVWAERGPESLEGNEEEKTCFPGLAPVWVEQSRTDCRLEPDRGFEPGVLLASAASSGSPGAGTDLPGVQWLRRKHQPLAGAACRGCGA